MVRSRTPVQLLIHLKTPAAPAAPAAEDSGIACLWFMRLELTILRAGDRERRRRREWPGSVCGVGLLGAGRIFLKFKGGREAGAGEEGIGEDGGLERISRMLPFATLGGGRAELPLIVPE